MITLPPSPPSPPSGPPRGMYFSRRKLTQPLPPWPPCTWILTRSTNIGAERPCEFSGRSMRVDNIDPATAAIELNVAVDQGEQRVVVALAHAFARKETIADLADQNVSGPNLLTAEPLYPSTLTVRVAAVAAGALSLFMRHGRLSPLCKQPLGLPPIGRQRLATNPYV